MSATIVRRGAAVLAAAAAVAATVAPAAAAQELEPEQLAQRVGIDQRLGAELPLRLPFVDETGAAVTLGEVIGERPAVLALVYYHCPMLCGLVLDGLTANLDRLGLAVGTDFDIVTVSIDPQETPAAAAAKKGEYVARYGFQVGSLERGWHALTGPPESIERLARTVGFRYVYDEASNEFAHGAAILVVTPEGTVSRYFYGVEYPPRDLRLALVEASQNRIGSLVDQVFLLCYRYDPALGRYTFAVWTALRVAGVLTLLALGGFIAVSLRRERRTAAAPGGCDEPR